MQVETSISMMHKVESILRSFEICCDESVLTGVRTHSSQTHLSAALASRKRNVVKISSAF